MRIPRSWLLEFLPEPIPTPRLATLLTDGIAEVESIKEVEGDDVFELGIKPDRGDCLSVEGIAREVAALAGVPFQERFPYVDLRTEVRTAIVSSCNADASATPRRLALGVIAGPRRGTSPADVTMVSFQIEAPDLCARYVGGAMDGIRVGVSPEWLQRRIRQIGLRPVNNVVDVTNYVMFELGQPLHAFDLDRLQGFSILVRTARSGEELVAINGERCALADDQLVIADAAGPVAIAGVMGGMESEVSETTTRIVLESARFDPISVRRTRRSLGFTSDVTQASYRFERKVDGRGCLRAALRAANLIEEIAGKGARVMIDLYPGRGEESSVILLRPERLNRILGMALPVETIRESLERLGLGVREQDGVLEVSVPSRRPDLEIEEDLIEEAARIVGYDRVPVTLPMGQSTPGGVVLERQVGELVRDALAGSGFTEVRTYSLTNPPALARARESTPPPRLRNPTSQERTVLRPALLPSLLETVETALTHGFRDQHLFEVGRVFVDRPGEAAPAEAMHVAAFAMGSSWPGAWSLPLEIVDSDFYTVRGVLDNLAAAVRLSIVLEAASDHPALHPGRAARVRLSGREALGWIGELHPQIVEEYGLPRPAVVFELEMAPLIAAYRESSRRPVDTDVARQPPATRDLAIVVPEEVPYAEVIQTIRDAEPLVAEARLFDLYRGAGIGAGEKSLAIALVLRAPGRTFTDAEANAALDGIVAVLGTKFGARRR